MASPRPRRRRVLLPAALAVVLAIEVTGLAIARSLAGRDAPATVGTELAGASATVVDGRADGPSAIGLPADPSPTSVPGARVIPSTANLRPPAPNLAATAHATTTTAGAPAPHSRTYRGRNHVWIPSLRISSGVQSFPCSRSRPPDAGAYRWGCAGRNNVYLLAHAWSTFKPLHDAYVGGRLRAGLKVWYADGSSHVHEYSVVWWRVVAPTTAASWAWAAQRRPSMTLQTCVGSNSQYRLMVRLLQVE